MPIDKVRVSIASIIAMATFMTITTQSFAKTPDGDEPATAPAAQLTFFGGYQTSAGINEYAAKAAAEHADLVIVHDIGDSYRKTTGSSGHDILAVCITKKTGSDCQLTADSAKPKLVIMAGIHARELAAIGVSQLFLDDLLSGYGKDSQISNILDTREIWILPNVNPDGLDEVSKTPDKPGWQRKNMNHSGGDEDCEANADLLAHRGVDLNRNFSFFWEKASGLCAQTYPGVSPTSEPETQAIESFAKKIFFDTRKDDLSSPAEKNTRGIFISLHSNGGLVLYPFGHTAKPAPDSTALRNLAQLFAAENKYRAGTPQELVDYSPAGGTDDFIYGTLGVPAFTFELGAEADGEDCVAFAAKYTCMKEKIYPPNKAALLKAADVAASPYLFKS